MRLTLISAILPALPVVFGIAVRALQVSPLSEVTKMLLSTAVVPVVVPDEVVEMEQAEVSKTKAKSVSDNFINFLDIHLIYFTNY